MTKTVDISGMDPQHSQYGYEWGCQVLMFRALQWLRTQPKDFTEPLFTHYKNIIGIMPPSNPAAHQMEEFAIDHEKLREFGATGAMVQYALMHAMQRFKLGENAYFAAVEPDRIFDFDESEAFPQIEVEG